MHLPKPKQRCWNSYKVPYHYGRGSPYDVTANVLDCDIVGSEFEFQLLYYIHAWTNTCNELKKNKNKKNKNKKKQIKINPTCSSS